MGYHRSRPSEHAAARESMSDDEESDLFSVKPYLTGESIPVIERVPLTKEESRRRRLWRVGYVFAGCLVGAACIWAALRWMHLREVDAALSLAERGGRVGTVRAALSLVERDDDLLSRSIVLRLKATLVLSGAEEPDPSLADELERLASDDADVLREQAIASTYLALAAGDLAGAMRHASSVEASGPRSAEAARARALAARSVGNVEQALSAARIAHESQAGSPRHAALLAEIMARSGRAAAALELLDALPAANRNAAWRCARARVLDLEGGDPEQVTAFAEEVLADSDATRHERAWAHLLLGRAVAASGDRNGARRHLTEADEIAPVGDELFTLGLTEAASRIGATHLAEQTASRLPPRLSVDAGRRAQLSAEIALATGDLDAADAALRHAPSAPRTSLAAARVAEARRGYGRARRLYLEASEEPSLRVPALTKLAAMELGRGNAQAAADHLQPLLEAHDEHPDVIPVAVEAQVGLGALDRALELVEPALRRHPDDVRLLAAKAHVQMGREQWEGALATLDEALALVDDDESLHADRGRAAQRLARFEVAREAYDRALELSPAQPQALVGRLELDLDAFLAPAAREIMDRIDAASIISVTIERLRARLLMMEVAGASGIRKVRAALRRFPGDLSLRVALGWLMMQAEQYAETVRFWTQVMDAAEDPLEATLARSLAQIRIRASAPAAAVLENLLEDFDESAHSDRERALVHAVLARLAWDDRNRARAREEAERAVALDSRMSEAHLVLAELAIDAETDPVPEYLLALRGYHPPSRPLASLAIREPEVTDAICGYASRYRASAPQGQYTAGVGRVLRSCRARE